jgi:hypothetical protein
MGRALSTNEEKVNTYRILVGRPEGKIPLGRVAISTRIILE